MLYNTPNIYWTQRPLILMNAFQDETHNRSVIKLLKFYTSKLCVGTQLAVAYTVKIP